MTSAEQIEFIEKVFSDKVFFEAHILAIKSNSDRIEVADILAKRMIRLLLKEELNFLYMQNMKNFRFFIIMNLMFKEIANEWVSYASEKLALDQEEAIEILHEKPKALFVLTLVKEYYKNYKIYFIQEIADSFIDLIQIMPSAMKSNELIDEVLSSNFIKNENISIIQSYSQLWGKVRKAHYHKNRELAKLQVALSEVKEKEKKISLEYMQEELEERPLAFFDDTLLRLRNTMVQYMMGIESYIPIH